MAVDVLPLPPPQPWPDAEIIAVVDCLRATTMATALLDAGALAVIAAATESLARQLKASKGALLAGEVGGLPPVGFDLGNSPAAIEPAIVAGREVVLFTTNGTRALTAARGGTVIAGAATNASACARVLARSHSALIVCAGEAGGTAFALEDFAAAACIVRAMARTGVSAAWGDGARLALGLASPVELIAGARHAAALRDLGLSADIDIAARIDSSGVVPVVTGRGDGWVRLEPLFS